MTPEQLHLRDEVLQVLYWLKGEGLGEDCSPKQFALWTGVDEVQLVPVLEFMLRDGWLEPGAIPDTYCFTPLGEREGKRRFADAFVDHGLGWGGPGGCGPGCEDCMINGPEHCHVHNHPH